jgi:integrase/recombinase XerC
MSAYANAIARPPRTLTEREVALLLRVSGMHRAGWRDHVIFSLALGTGLREHEILALDIGDVFDAAHRAKRHVCLRVFKRASDDPPPQEIVLSDTLRAKLEQLLRQKRAESESVESSAPLFVSLRGNRLSARQLRHTFSVWQQRAGFDRIFNFHALRHTACSNLYRRTRDIRLTQRFARHRSLMSTAIYTHPTDEELVRSVQELPC